VASACPSRRRHAKSSHAHHTISCANVQLARVLAATGTRATARRIDPAGTAARCHVAIEERQSAISRRKAVARLDRGP
jgi:hypothetical protein